VITVSNSLAHDIRRFSRNEAIPATAVDNVVDTAVFHPDPQVRPAEGTLLAMAAWKTPKRPEVLIEAMAELRGRGVHLRLRMAGDGPLMQGVKERAQALALEDRVTFIGRLAPDEAAREMRAASFFMHCSDHETFSVVCAEALCCGTPVIASRVGGIPEYLEAGGGWLVESNTATAWADAIETALRDAPRVDRPAVVERMRARSSPRAVGERYTQVLRSALSDRSRG
jgi:glycosyltransferase involved in cell wall biosynthesis